MLDDYTRAQVNRAIEDALRPRGMSIHDGKTRIHVHILQRLVAMVDHYAKGQRDAQERIAELEREAMILRILLDKRPAMNEGLREAYATWSAEVYALDIRKALNGASPSDGGAL